MFHYVSWEVLCIIVPKCDWTIIIIVTRDDKSCYHG